MPEPGATDPTAPTSLTDLLRSRSEEAARHERRATLTPHMRLVEDLIDEFTDAIHNGTVLEFFERTAARILSQSTED